MNIRSAPTIRAFSTSDSMLCLKVKYTTTAGNAEMKSLSAYFHDSRSRVASPFSIAPIRLQ